MGGYVDNWMGSQSWWSWDKAGGKAGGTRTWNPSVKTQAGALKPRRADGVSGHKAKGERSVVRSGQLVTGVGKKEDREPAPPSVGEHRVVQHTSAMKCVLLHQCKAIIGLIAMVGIKHPHSSLKLL